MLSELIANQAGQIDTTEKTGNGESEKEKQKNGTGGSESGKETKQENDTGNEKKQQQSENGDNKKEEGDGSGKEKKSSEQDGQDKKPEEDTQKTNAEDMEKTFKQQQSLFGISQWKEDNWKMIKVLTDSLYFTWNSLQPELIKKGITSNQVGYFNAALEDMSKFITEKNIEEAQIAAFRMAEALAAYTSYYRTKTPAELKRIKSLTIGIHFFAGQNDWEKSQELANQLQQEFSKLKPLMQNNQSQSFQMLEYSLADLNNSVQKQDFNLLVLRTNLVTSNLREIENELSQGQKK